MKNTAKVVVVALFTGVVVVVVGLLLAASGTLWSVSNQQPSSRPDVAYQSGPLRAGDFLVLEVRVYDLCGRRFTADRQKELGVSEPIEVWLRNAQDYRAPIKDNGTAQLYLLDIAAGSYGVEVHSKNWYSGEVEIQIWPNQKGTITVNLSGWNAIAQVGISTTCN